jgi:hypothetical protein
MPFFIADFFGLPVSAANVVSKSWLSLYLWSVCIDKVMDGENPVSADDHMLYAQLLTYFLEHVGGARIKLSTKAEIVSDVCDAMRFQSYSIPGASVDKTISLEDVRSGKNLLFLAVGRLIFSRSEGDRAPLKHLCESFSGVLQALDDLTDIQADLGLGITTPIIKKLGLRANASSSTTDVLDALVNSGELAKELDWAASELEAILSMCPNKNGHSFDFLERLYSEISTISGYAHEKRTNDVSERISTIYCST